MDTKEVPLASNQRPPLPLGRTFAFIKVAMRSLSLLLVTHTGADGDVCFIILSKYTQYQKRRSLKSKRPIKTQFTFELVEMNTGHVNLPLGKRNGSWSP